MTTATTRLPSTERGEVARIVADVRDRGDDALGQWSRALDGEPPRRAEPGGDFPATAFGRLVVAVRRWHSLQRPRDVRLETEPGVELERRWVPLGAVGIYVPRGLLSTLAMCAVPAQVAGVKRIVVATPPSGAPVVAAAARSLGVDEVWAVGGPHAIAALAYGTASIAKVDKIVGPGNAHVNEAKLLVGRDVAIDLPAGPTEIVVVLGEGGDRRLADLELAAQAEHGPGTQCRLVEMDDDPEVTLALVESLAPEHVLLLGTDAEGLASRICNAGTVLVGASSSSAAGDYATGANHVLPTGGWACRVGGLGLETFMRPVTVQRLTARGLRRLRDVIERLAEAEGMTAHARAAHR